MVAFVEAPPSCTTRGFRECTDLEFGPLARAHRAPLNRDSKSPRCDAVNCDSRRLCYCAPSTEIIIHRKSTRLSTRLSSYTAKHGQQERDNQHERQKHRHAPYSEHHKNSCAHERPTNAKEQRARVERKAPPTSKEPKEPTKRVLKRRKGYEWTKRRLPQVLASEGHIGGKTW
jgi:hypothetical protein